MQLRWHFAISLLVSYILVVFHSLDFKTSIIWIIIGCFVGTLIDIDHIILSLLTEKDNKKILLKNFFNPRKLIKYFEFGGMLFISPVKVKIFQTFTSFLVFTLTFFFFPQYYLIVGVVLLVHNISDLPEVVSYLKKYGKYTKRP